MDWQELYRCRHKYRQFRRWPVKERYQCVLCGCVTRLYDSVDWMVCRPIHPHIMAAVKGYNIIDRRWPLSEEITRAYP